VSAATSRLAGIVMVDEKLSWEGVMYLVTRERDKKRGKTHESRREMDERDPLARPCRYEAKLSRLIVASCSLFPRQLK